MKYEVKFTGSFETQEEAYAFANIIEGLKGKLYKDSREGKGEELYMDRKLEVWHCGHDEVPAVQCKLLKTVDFDKPEEWATITEGKGELAKEVEPRYSSILKDSILDRVKIEAVQTKKLS